MMPEQSTFWQLRLPSSKKTSRACFLWEFAAPPQTCSADTPKAHDFAHRKMSCFFGGGAETWINLWLKVRIKPSLSEQSDSLYSAACLLDFGALGSVCTIVHHFQPTVFWMQTRCLYMYSYNPPPPTHPPSQRLSVWQPVSWVSLVSGVCQQAADRSTDRRGLACYHAPMCPQVMLCVTPAVNTSQTTYGLVGGSIPGRDGWTFSVQIWPVFVLVLLL